MKSYLTLSIIFMVLSLGPGCHNRLPKEPDARARPLDANLLLITIDTIRADHLGCYGYKSIRTPHIDKLASEGVLFSQALTPVPITLPSHCSIMTGLYPVQHGVRDNGNFSLSKEAITLAEVMKGYGYQTGACVGSFVLDSVFGLDQGFDYYDDRFAPHDSFTPEKKAVKMLYNERKAEEISQVAISWLEKEKDNRFFLWLHYFDPHPPYFPPPSFSFDYGHNLSSRDRRYDGEIAYVDMCLGKLFDKMRAMELMDKTIIILVGDHGEGLGEHKEDTHAIFIYDSTLKVPFIIRAPALFKGGQKVKSLVSTLDIVPTVVRLFSLKPIAGLAGKDLVPLLNGQGREIHTRIMCESLYPELNFGWSRLEGLRTPEWKYIRAPKPELFHLADDPGEKSNLFERGSYDYEPWQASLDRCKEDYQPTAWASKEVGLEPEVEQRLKSLGYTWTRSPGDMAEDRSKADPKDMIQVMNYLDNGLNLLVLKCFDQAIEELEKIIKLDQQNLEAYFYLGWAFQRKGELDKAEILYRKCLEINPQYSEACNNLGLIHYRKGEWDLALKEFQKSLAIGKSREVYYYAGLVYAKAGQMEEAIASLKKSLELDPDYVEGLNYLGNLYLARNDLEEAAKYYEKAIELDQRSVTALNGLGLVCLNLNDYQKAEHLFQKALAIGKNAAESYSHLGYLSLLKGAFARAVSYYQQMLSLQPDDSQGYYYLGKAYQSLGQKEAALGAWQKSLTLQPEAAGVHLDLGNLYFEMGDLKKAQEEWETALAGKSVDIANHLINLGTLYFRLQQYEMAISAWQSLSELKPDDPFIHYNLSLAYVKQGQYEDAYFEIKECLRLQPDFQNAYPLLERIKFILEN